MAPTTRMNETNLSSDGDDDNDDDDDRILSNDATHHRGDMRNHSPDKRVPLNWLNYETDNDNDAEGPLAIPVSASMIIKEIAAGAIFFEMTNMIVQQNSCKNRTHQVNHQHVYISNNSLDFVTKHLKWTGTMEKHGCCIRCRFCVVRG
mmetsp:Transcript_4388/g.11059  ORF Transcript_4388/g.11059 Transcript_4388/m.11059 type:complete len:148 (-) Transcript_4388:6-449(-)